MSFPPFPAPSSLTTKYIMAITGAGLALFVLFHMIGNLLVFVGPDALNTYAEHIQALPGLLWVARLGLIVFFVVHVLLGVRLALFNAAARPVRYQYEDTRVASAASRYMLATGVLVLLFLLYHLAHFTFGLTDDARLDGRVYNYLELKQKYDPITGVGVAADARTAPSGTEVHERRDVYAMVIVGFRKPLIAGLYLVAQFALWLHLWHGVSSLWQSLGVAPVQENRLVAVAGPLFATVIFVGNSAIVLAVLLRFIGGGVPG